MLSQYQHWSEFIILMVFNICYMGLFCVKVLIEKIVVLYRWLYKGNLKRLSHTVLSASWKPENVSPPHLQIDVGVDQVPIKFFAYYFL